MLFLVHFADVIIILFMLPNIQTVKCFCCLISDVDLSPLVVFCRVWSGEFRYRGGPGKEGHLQRGGPPEQQTVPGDGLPGVRGQTQQPPEVSASLLTCSSSSGSFWRSPVVLRSLSAGIVFLWTPRLWWSSCRPSVVLRSVRTTPPRWQTLLWTFSSLAAPDWWSSACFISLNVNEQYLTIKAQ